MRGVLSLAYITFKEGIRNRAIFGIFILALLMFAVTVTLTNLFMKDITKVAVDLSLSTISFSGLLMVMFIGTNLLAKDIDKRTIYMVLSRPLSRAQYIIGKYFGLCLLVVVSVIFLGVISSLPVYAAQLSYKNPQALFDWSVYGYAILGITLKLTLIASVIVFFSSFTTTSFITLILTIVTYLIGSTNEVVKALLDAKMEGVTISPFIAKIINFVYVVFPNLSSFDLKIQAAHGLALPSGYLFWLILYWLVYNAIMVTGSALIMQRREFP